MSRFVVEYQLDDSTASLPCQIEMWNASLHIVAEMIPGTDGLYEVESVDHDDQMGSKQAVTPLTFAQVMEFAAQFFGMDCR